MTILVNGDEITSEEIYAEMQYHAANSLEEAMVLAGRALVIKKLLLQQVKERAITIADDETDATVKEEALIEALLEQEIKRPDLNETTIKNYYEKHLKRFKNPTTDTIAPLTEVKEVIINYLTDSHWQSAAFEYLKLLIQSSQIEGITFD